MIEGAQTAVESLYGSIEQDRRHDEVTLVRTREQRAREFPGWSMAFGAVDEGRPRLPTGATDPRPTDAEATFVRDLLAVLDDADRGPRPGAGRGPGAA